MQSAGVQPGGQVALAVAQRGVLQNPGGATGQLGGVGTGTAPAAAPAQRRGRYALRQTIAERQVQGGTQGTQGTQGGTQQGGTPTNGNNPVATQLLLAPTFTPIQAQAVLDPVNMRIAIPVSAVDGEYILTMQTGGGQGQAQPAAAPEGQQQPQGQTPPTPEGQTPSPSAGQAQPEPSAAAGNATAPAAAGEQKPEASAAPAEGEKKPEGAAAPAEGEKKPEGEAAPAEGEKKPERRQDKGEEKPPTGGVFITMKEINQMATVTEWGGQAPISQMMNDYVKANNGTSKI